MIALVTMDPCLVTHFQAVCGLASGSYRAFPSPTPTRKSVLPVWSTAHPQQWQYRTADTTAEGKQTPASISSKMRVNVILKN